MGGVCDAVSAVAEDPQISRSFCETATVLSGNPFAREEVQYTKEFERIASLPRRTWSEADLETLADKMTALLKTPNGKMRLFPIQALALWELMNYGGLFGAMQVGAGKELVCFLAGVVMQAKHPMLIMPAHLVRRSQEEEMPEYAKDWRISKNLRIISYQMLGQANHDKALEIVPPDLFIYNEVQRIKNPNAAVSRRCRRHMVKFPNARVVAVTGTPVAQSITDFAPVVRWCIKPSPVPSSYTELQEWADALDEKSTGYNQREPGALLRLCNAEELKEEPVIAARRGFRRRLTETPGFVATAGEDNVFTKHGDAIRLTVRALHYEQDSIVETHFKKLREEWETPSGWQFSIAMGVWRHARTLALGLHYDWDPPPEGGPDGPWCIRRRAWKKFVRGAIKESQKFDSELQVTNACLKGALDNTTFNAWREIEPSYRPVSRATWHDEAALQACQRWIADGPGVIFTDHTFFAEELSRRTGCRFFGAGGVDKTGMKIEQADPNSCVIASRQANATGRNLQFWNRALVTSAPHNGLEWDQMLGRLHRHGQQHDVVFDVLLGCVENYDGWMRSLDLAQMAKDSLGMSQKLLIAKTEFPSELQMELRKSSNGATQYKWDRTVDRS